MLIFFMKGEMQSSSINIFLQDIEEFIGGNYQFNPSLKINLEKLRFSKGFNGYSNQIEVLKSFSRLSYYFLLYCLKNKQNDLICV